MSNIKIVQPKPSTKPQKATRTVVDTIIFDLGMISKWKSPAFQRPIRVNAKVEALAESLKSEGGILPGIMTLGVLDGETYLLDGQHRREAFKISGLTEGYTDIRTHYFETMGAMGEEFVRLNSQLVRLRPDDILRGLEQSSSALMEIRRRCPYVGYDMIRRGANSPILGMSVVIGCWSAAGYEVPGRHGNSTAAALAASLSADEVGTLCGFLAMAYAAWGRDAEYQRLWGALNLTLCMWLYRRVVLTTYSPKTPQLTMAIFGKCITSLSADPQYVDYLVGRQLSDRDRTPCYRRMKEIIGRRIYEETGKKSMLPQPEWAS